MAWFVERLDIREISSWEVRRFGATLEARLAYGETGRECRN